MATTGSSPITLSELTLVDVDSHVSNSLDDLLPYMDERHDGVKKMIEFADNPAMEIYSRTRTTPAWFQTRNQEDFGERLVHGGRERTTPENKIRLMDEFGIDYTILSTGPNGLASVNHDQTAVAIAEAYNSYLLDNFVDVEDRLKSNIIVPPQKPHKGAEEIDRLGNEKDIVGVQIPGTGLIPPAGHEWYDPIYQAAQDHGLPVLMHSGNSPSTSAFPVQRHWAETFVEDHAFTFPVEAMWHLISMVFQGVPERYPDLNFVFQESGVEWVGWIMGRLDDHYLQCSQDVPILTKLPSEYILDQFHFGSQPLGERGSPEHTAMLIEAAGGPDTVMYATDHPHPDFDPPEEMFQKINSYFDDDDVRRMMGETALSVFDLK